ncbi:MAG: hypothetical protein QXE31_03990 [Candidatus Woesearchaeota archaeon]
MKKLFAIVLMLSLILGACTQYEYKENVSQTNNLENQINEKNNEITGEVVEVLNEEKIENVEQKNQTKQENKENEKEEKNNMIIAYEGDLIDLKPYVYDADGDDIKIGYSFPFDENGKWQTKKGDAGFYSVIITATDKKNSLVMKQMVIKVLVKNKSPIIQIDDVLEFNEGDLIELKPLVFDEDDKEVSVKYTGWMTSNKYQTTYEDSGEYEVTITADDGKDPVEKKIRIIVKNVNREPILELEQENYTITEGDLLQVKATAKDPDNDKVELSFGKPLSESGKWQTQKGDAGKYLIKVSANDGQNVVKKDVEVEVLKKNEPPIIKSIEVVPQFVELKQPGDEVKVTIKVNAEDPDKDELTITYSGDMESEEKVFKYGEKGGIKKVKVSVSDGKESVSEEVSFEMNNWPCFDCQSLIKAQN